MDTGEEVGDAGNDAGGRLRADLLQCGTEDRRVSASQNLSCLQSRIGTNGVLVHMVSNVRIADQCKDRGHLEFFLKTFFWIKISFVLLRGFSTISHWRLSTWNLLSLVRGGDRIETEVLETSRLWV